jgi:hypothetical protein
MQNKIALGLDVNVACIWLGNDGSTILKSLNGNPSSLANCCFNIWVVYALPIIIIKNNNNYYYDLYIYIYIYL